VINSDSHRVAGFEVARYGVATARRAWLTAAQVVNTGPWASIEAIRPRNRAGGSGIAAAPRAARTRRRSRA